MHTYTGKGKQKGAILATFAVSALVLVLIFGLAIDSGFLYMSRAALAKGADAAALMGVRSLGKGEAEARRVAISTFTMNYAGSKLPARQVSNPQVTVSFVTEGSVKRVLVDARVQVRPFFISILPGLDSVSVSALAGAVRAKLIMALALDRSGSMNGNGGAAALPGATSVFIDFFDDDNDQAAMASYADHARPDVPIRFEFKSRIKRAASELSFGGWTYSHGGIDIGRAQINSVALPENENVLRALVFFTDGHANSFLGNVICDRPKKKGEEKTINLVLVPGNDSDDFRDPGNGGTVDCDAAQASTFFSEKYQQNRTRNSANVTEEGLFRAERSAQLARQDGTLVFAIGLGNDINRNSLRKMANDPASPSFNAAEPEGIAAFAPTAADLDDVFRQIAAKILLRLTP
jgi:Flp pilus assembly protein TadG